MVRTHRQEWIETCKKVRQEIETERQRSWRSFIEETEFSTDPSKLWRVFHSIGNTTPPSQPNEALTVNKRVLHSNIKKADAFAAYYARQSKLTFNKEERNENRLSKKIVNAPSVDNSSTQSFSASELNKAIRSMRKNGAAGPDEITPAFIKAFGPKAREELLALFNLSWDQGVCPQEWKNATIIPLLKTGKPASEISSYRPISLTSCLVKLLERMIATRLIHIVETNGLLSNAQCGGRKNRCCEDLITRLTQAIDDGFQEKKPKRTVMALFDYSKAFDTVWRERLLIILSEKGIPAKFIRWIAAFLNNRQARVLYGSAMSRSHKIKQGVPQGSVLAPLLFLLFIDEVTKNLPAEHALFVDDLSVWSCDNNKEKAVERVQKAIDHVAEWSRKFKLSLNQTKCEVTFFASGTTEARWKPTLRLNDEVMPFNPTPKFLGIKMDRGLTFAPHAEEISQKVSKRTNLIRAVATRDWGWQKKTLRKIYIATQRSVLDYAAPAWEPNLSQTQFDKLERSQNKALRAITGQCSSTAIEALQIESGISSYRTHSNRLIASSHQKASRNPPDHPRTQILYRPAPNRLKGSSWRRQSEELNKTLPTAILNPRQTVQVNHPPWLSSSNWHTNVTVNGRNKDVTLNEVISHLDSFNCNLTIYTDGSAIAGTTDGGYAAIFTRGSASNPEVIRIIRKRGSIITSSYDEEKAALLSCLEILEKHHPYDKEILICTNSQSLCTALNSQTRDTEELRKFLDRSEKTIWVQWVPRHSELKGNEIADEEAKNGSKLTTEQPESTSLKAALSCIKRSFRDPAPSHQRTKRTYAGYSEKKR